MIQYKTYGHNVATMVLLNHMVSCELQVQDRVDVPNVIVLITNAASTSNTLQTIATAQSIQQLGTQILAIGSTSRVNVTELQLIASAPHLQNHEWWTITDFSTTSLANIQSDFSKELCRPVYGNAP